MDAVRLIFEHGEFDKMATFMVTEALWFLSVSIIPYVFRDSITRVFYSFNDSATPFTVAFSSIVLKVFLNWILISKMHFGIGGITLSTSVVTLFNACILGYFITKKMKMDYKSLFKNFLKMSVAGVVAGVVCYFAAVQFDKFILLPKIPFELLKISIIAFICLFVYIPLNLLMKMEYASELFDRLKSKFIR